MEIPPAVVADRTLPPWMWPRSAYPGNWNEKEPVWAQPPPPQPSFQSVDPFFDASRDAVKLLRRSENISDISMPDYVSSFKGSRDSRDTSGQTGSSMKSVMYHRKGASQASVKKSVAPDDPEYNDLIDALKGKEQQQQQQQQQKVTKRAAKSRKSQSRSTRESRAMREEPAITVPPLLESTPTGVTLASSTSKSPSSVLAVAGSAASRKFSHQAGALLELPQSKTNSRIPSASSAMGVSSGAGTDREHPFILDDIDDEDDLDSPIPRLAAPSDLLRSKKEAKDAIRRRKLTSEHSSSSLADANVLFRGPELSVSKASDTPPPHKTSSGGGIRAGGDNSKRKRSSQVSPLSQLEQTPNGGGNETSGLALESDDSVIRDASPTKKKVIRLVDPDGEDQENLGGEIEALLGSDGGLAAVAAAATTAAAAGVGEGEEEGV